jgi:solute carrier family 50 protein (sugar transporter)
VGPLPLLPYSSMIANCFLWITYGLLKNEPKVWGTNLLGLFFGVYYFLKFTKYAPAKSSTLPGSILQHVNACLSVIAVTFGLVYISPFKDPASIIGNLAVMFCVAMFASPLAALKTVLQTKSAKSIPLPFTLATLLNCFLWSVVGLFDMKDVNIYLPNLLGLACGLAQLTLKLLYGDGTGNNGESELELLM